MEKKVENHGRLRQVLADNLLAQRHKLGLSQEAFADMAGLHRTYIGHIENCRQAVSVDNIERLADALSIPAHVLLTPIELAPGARQRRIGEGSTRLISQPGLPPSTKKVAKGVVDSEKPPTASKTAPKPSRAPAATKRTGKAEKAL